MKDQWAIPRKRTESERTSVARWPEAGRIRRNDRDCGQGGSPVSRRRRTLGLKQPPSSLLDLRAGHEQKACRREQSSLPSRADIAEVIYITADKGMIFFSILLMDFVQVGSPALAFRQCGETLTSYAASPEPNHRSVALNSLRRGIIRNAVFRCRTLSARCGLRSKELPVRRIGCRRGTRSGDLQLDWLGEAQRSRSRSLSPPGADPHRRSSHQPHRRVAALEHQLRYAGSVHLTIRGHLARRYTSDAYISCATSSHICSPGAIAFSILYLPCPSL